MFIVAPYQRLVGSLSANDYSINIGVLQTAHSIFSPWRASTRSDKLWATINNVLNRFAQPFLQLLTHTSNLLLSRADTEQNSTLELRAQALVIMTEIYYDLSCQDLPPLFEDTHTQFFGANQSLFLQFMTWEPAELQGDVRPHSSTRYATLMLTIHNCSPTIPLHLSRRR